MYTDVYNIHTRQWIYLTKTAMIMNEELIPNQFKATNYEEGYLH